VYASAWDTARLDDSSNEELLLLRATNEDDLMTRSLPIIAKMMFENFESSWDFHWFEDMVSEAQVGALKAIRSWQPEGGQSLSTWIYTLSRQAALRCAEKEAEYSAPLASHDFAESIDDEDESPENPNDTHGGPQGHGEAAMEAETEYALLKQKLSRENGLLLDMLRDGYSQREIGRAWNISQKSVSRKVAVLERLVRSLCDVA
jgi:RNA polymerase sigma factor (sigma-70 family)